MARLTAEAPCHPSRTLPHPGRTLPLVTPVQQEVARESQRSLSYIKKAGMKGQGKVGHVEACLGMPGHVGTCPGREPQTSPRGGPTTKPSNQEPTRSPWTPITAEPTFSSLYGSPARAIKPFPTPHTSQTPFASQTPFTSVLTRPREFCPGATAQ